MQYENEDIDDLFRRAAENYPLDTSSKDWAKVLQAMQNEANDPTPVQKNSKGRFLWLLLLLPMALLCNRYLMPGDHSPARISAGTQSKEAGTDNKNTPATNTNSIAGKENTLTKEGVIVVPAQSQDV